VVHPSIKELTLSQTAKLLAMDLGQLSRDAKTGRYGVTRTAFIDGRRVRLIQVEALERARGRIFTPRELEAVAGPQPDELTRRVFAAVKVVAAALNERWRFWILTPTYASGAPMGQRVMRAPPACPSMSSAEKTSTPLCGLHSTKTDIPRSESNEVHLEEAGRKFIRH
jgi:hypothetical protein